jgi:hypothetical protein
MKKRKTTTLGNIHLGVEGVDTYMVVSEPDQVLEPDDVRRWLIERLYTDTDTPGGYFCHSVSVTPHPNERDVIAVVHHRYNV